MDIGARKKGTERHPKAFLQAQLELNRGLWLERIFMCSTTWGIYYLQLNVLHYLFIVPIKYLCTNNNGALFVVMKNRFTLPLFPDGRNSRKKGISEMADEGIPRHSICTLFDNWVSIASKIVNYEVGIWDAKILGIREWKFPQNAVRVEGNIG